MNTAQSCILNLIILIVFSPTFAPPTEKSFARQWSRIYNFGAATNERQRVSEVWRKL